MQPTATEVLAVTLVADASSVSVVTDTVWMENATNGDERRCASGVVDGRRWRALDEHHETVLSREQLRRFVLRGGHALAAKDVLERWWPAFFEPIDCLRYHGFMPYLSTAHLPFEAKQRHARGRLRKTVFARDEDRCRQCGYSIDDDLRVKLNIHHVVPWAKGGLTVEDNLIVLCDQCHTGMDAIDVERWSDLQNKIAISAARFHRRKHVVAVGYYREHMRRIVEQPAEDPVSPVLPQGWGDEPQLGFRLAYQLLCSNAVVRCFSIPDWRSIARKVLRKRRAISEPS